MQVVENFKKMYEIHFQHVEEMLLVECKVMQSTATSLGDFLM